MTFHKYPDLPLELRLQIIEDAVATRMTRSRKRRISPLATVDREWKQVVERITFRNITIYTPFDVHNFAAICGPRNGVLKRLSCVFEAWDPFQFPTSVSPRTVITGGIIQLFRIMKHWNREDRSDLITVTIHASVPNGGVRYHVFSETSDLSLDLPELPAVGKMYAQLGFPRDTILSHDTITALHMKLPNLHGAQLAIPTASGSLLQATINDARNGIIELHAMKPGLTRLRFISNNPWNSFWQAPVDRTTQIKIAKSLGPHISLWKNSLVSLKLDCIVDAPQLLFNLGAGNTLWPNLVTMDLVGVVDSTVTRFRNRDDRIDACDDLLRGLVAALPGMPSLAKLSTRFRNTHNRRFAFSFCMDIGARRDVERQVWQLRQHTEPSKRVITPCRPVPVENATAKAHGIVLPGPLVTDLQRVVWQQRQLELSVFCCMEDDPSGMNFGIHPCSQWDREMGEWDLLLLNNMDRFIYDMGQYWEQA